MKWVELNLLGQKFFRLTPKQRAYVKNREMYWLCDCDCGGECVVSARALVRGKTKSCGCLQRERTAEASRIHGLKPRNRHVPEYYQLCRQRDPSFPIRRNASCMMWKMLKRGTGGETLFAFLDYSLQELRAHLEHQFKPGMTWENYGEVWEIDHKKPHVLFPYMSWDGPIFKECWSLPNLQPLFKFENASKGSRFDVSTTKILSKI